MLAEIYLENIKASSKFLLTKNWCISVLGDTLAMYNSKYELKIKDVKIELSEQPRHTDGSVSDNPDTLKAYAGCWTSKKIIYINPYAINAYCYICKLDINDVTVEEFHEFMKFLITHELAHGVWEYYSNKKFKDSILESAKSDKFNTEYLDWVRKNNPAKLEEETFCEYMADSITTCGRTKVFLNKSSVTDEDVLEYLDKGRPPCTSKCIFFAFATVRELDLNHSNKIQLRIPLSVIEKYSCGNPIKFLGMNQTIMTFQELKDDLPKLIKQAIIGSKTANNTKLKYKYIVHCAVPLKPIPIGECELI